jgi:type IV pilus assembly protein PilY1
VDDTAAFSINDVTVAENGGSVDFTVTLSGESQFDVTVDYQTTDDTAAAGSDYAATNGTLTIPAGSLSGTLTVEILNPVDVEGTETFYVDLSNATIAPLISISDARGVGTINDNDHRLVLYKDGSADSGFSVVASSGSVSGAAGGTVSSFPHELIYDGQDTVTLTAVDTVPSAGCVFKGWDVDASGTDYTVSVAMGSDKNVYALFNKTHTLTVNLTGSGVDRGAAVSAGASGDSRFPGGSAPGSYVYETGSTISLAATDTHPPHPGCEFETWTVNSGDPGSGFGQTSKSTTVAVTGDLSITGDFIAVYAIQSLARENGTITPLGTTLKYHGENQTYDVAADGGYVVGDVVVDGFSQGAQSDYTFQNIEADHTIVAVFMLGEKPYMGLPAGDDQIYRASVPPLVLLVMGRNHKLYYEAYNDASDLNGDGTLDTRYNPAIEYYGYFDSYKVYKYDSIQERFYPVRYTLTKKVNPAATDEWSGDFLNYLTMSRIDVLRKVLYGGYRSTDTATETVLMRSYIPQDAHSWGKEYRSISHDGYDIREYTPLDLPDQAVQATRHLFASTSLEEGTTNQPDYDRPLLRVLTDSTYRIWEWVSIERPVAGTRCLDGASGPTCEHPAGSGGFHPGHPDNHAEYEDLVQIYADGSAAVEYGSEYVSQINGSGNPFHDPDDNYLTLFRGYVFVDNSGYYTFAVDGDDAVEVVVNGAVAAGYYGGHGRCNCYSHSGVPVYLSAGAHALEFRHEEATGGDNYYLWWSGPDSGDNWVIVPAASYNTGVITSETDVESGVSPSDIYSGGLAFVKRTTYELLTPETPASIMTDFVVKVKVGDATLPDMNSKKYPSGVYKPIGLLQRHGESGSMLFGLLSGSYERCSAGGVLRKTIGPITDEINPNTGEFLYQDNTSVHGVVKTIDSFRINNFRYSDYAYDPGWPDAWVTTRPMNTNEFPDWGNPIAEMMYEGIRYFAGKKAFTTEFDYGSSTSTEDYQLGLPRVGTWDDPFETNDICAKAFMLVLTDINPTYDSDQLPGVNTNFANGFTGTLSSADSPAVTLDAESTTDGVSAAEGGLGFHYIGQLNSTFDGSCVPKDLAGAGFGDVRGLCPEEPTKEGAYYSAGVAHFGRTHDMHPGEGEQNILSYIVALASPLPRIEIPVGNTTVTLVPFAKSVGGCLGIYPDYGYYQPTNTIVDFYVESLRPASGTFRINYEDVEQAADHDMDAIVIYEYQLLDDSENPVDHPSNATKVKITLTSEYAAGCIIQHMGYVISGTTADGTYLEVVDADTGTDVDFFLDTPPGVSPGDTGDPWDDNQPLPLVATRVFTAGQTTAATLLEDPLWYAAKYGGFVNLDDTTDPNLDSEWDKDADGVPDTYFYVVNPLKLEEQLNRSFADILARGVTHVAPVVSVDEANRTQSGDKLYMAFFRPMPENYWIGNIKKYGLSLETRSECGRTEPEWTVVDQNGTVAGECDGTFKANTISYWSTEQDGGHVDRGGVGAVMKDSMPGSDPRMVPASGPYYDFRNIFTYKNGGMTQFIHSNIDNSDLSVPTDLMRWRIINWVYGYTFDTRSSVVSDPIAKRDWILGDIIHSEPKLIDYLDPSTGELQYRFVAVGANDGMLHIFTDVDATIGGTSYSAGQEVFAFIPADLLPALQELGDATTHNFFVDGAPNLFRSTSKHSSGYYHKTLVFGERRGGRSYWALDITQPNPAYWDVKWHITGGPSALGGTPGFEELGYSWSRPLFAKLQTDASTIKDVVIFSGGYDPLEDGFPEPFEDLDEDGQWYDANENGLYDTGDEVFSATVGGTEGYNKYNPGTNNMGRGIFVLDLDDGTVLFKTTYGDDDNDGDETEDVTTGIDQKYAMMKYCFPADLAVIPFSPYEIVMYAADVYGQIWKVTYDYFADASSSYGDPNSTRWTVKRIFTANPGSDLATGDPDTFRAGTQALNAADAGRKMFHPPDVSYFGNDWTTKPVLYFGTGDRAHPRFAMISNRFYMVTDEDALADETDMLNVTCNELDADADADGDGGLDVDDDLIRAGLEEILESGTYSVRGLYRVLDEQGDCSDDALDHTGEKVLSQPTLFFKIAFFTSYQPIFDDPCNPMGNAFVYGVNYSDFTSAFNYDESNDTTGGEVRNITDTYRYVTGSSIPSGVKVITRQGTAAGVISAGGAVLGAGEGGSTTIPGPPGGISPMLWWRDN